MVICSVPGCNTTAGCKCGNGWPWQYPVVPSRLAGNTGPIKTPLWAYTDAELRNELHRRAMVFLGDQTQGVSFPSTTCAPSEIVEDRQ